MYCDPAQGRKGCWVCVGSSGEENGRVETLARGLSLLVALGEERDGSSLTELAERAGLPKPTAMRMLRTLQEFGFVSRHDRTYRVGYRCMALGNLYEYEEDLRARALPVMQGLMERTGEIVQLGVLRDRDVLYLERVEPQRSVAVIFSHPGSSRPAHCTALGKTILAFADGGRAERYLEGGALEARTAVSITAPEVLKRELTEVRGRGYSVDEGECDDEVRCVAAPIYDVGGRCAAAISISAPEFRMRGSVREEAGKLVVEAAREISSASRSEGGTSDGDKLATQPESAVRGGEG